MIELSLWTEDGMRCDLNFGSRNRDLWADEKALLFPSKQAFEAVGKSSRSHLFSSQVELFGSRLLVDSEVI